MRDMIKKVLIFVFVFLGVGGSCLAAEKPSDLGQVYEGVVQDVVEEKVDKGYQKLEVVLEENGKEKTVEVEVGSIDSANRVRYEEGDEVVVLKSSDGKKEIYQINGYVRRFSLFWLFLVFAVLVIVISRMQGVFSLLSMVFSFLVIFKFILPKILVGWDPVLTAIVGAMMIIPVTFYLSHGFNPKTTTAIIGTVISLIMVGVLAKWFVGFANLTGYNEEIGFLQVGGFELVNSQGLFLAGIIIGVLGVLDDITVSQAAFVYQLKRTKIGGNFKELYSRAMSVGRDHIASMVNTLVLVYTGASLPLLLLFILNPDLNQILNYELVAEEVVRTLVGSIGLVLAVPITTFLATVVSFED